MEKTDWNKDSYLYGKMFQESYFETSSETDRGKEIEVIGRLVIQNL